MIKIGDIVGMVYAQPGNDVTYLLVRGIEGDTAALYDVMFEFEVRCRVDRLWIATEHELDSTVGFSGGKRSGSYTIRQLADEARAKYKLPPAPPA